MLERFAFAYLSLQITARGILLQKYAVAFQMTNKFQLQILYQLNVMKSQHYEYFILTVASDPSENQIYH